MNILLLTTIYPEPENYGIESDTKVVHYFAREWVKMGHRVVVFHLHTNAIKNVKRCIDTRYRGVRYNKREGVEVFCASTQIFVPHSFVPYKWQQERAARRMLKSLANEIPDFTPNVISVHFPMSLLHFFGRIKEIYPEVSSYAVFHGSDIRELQKRQYDMPQLKGSFNGFLCRSPKLKDRAIMLGVDESKCHLALSGIEETLLLKPYEVEIKASRSEIRDWHIVYVGKINSQKCVDTIINAVYSIRNEYSVHLDIVGDGPDTEILKQKVIELSFEQSVTFWGHQSREVSVKLMKEADVFVMVSRNETFGLVYVEAMSQGCIAIGSKGEGIDGFIVDGENGYLVEPANVDALADKLRFVFELQLEKRRSIIENSYRKATMLTDAKAAQQYLAIIKG